MAPPRRFITKRQIKKKKAMGRTQEKMMLRIALPSRGGV
jgi:hypothetical protein